MARIRRPTKEEIRARRAAIAERASAGKLTLPAAFHDIRHALGLSQEEFAKLFRLTTRQVKEIEGGSANPTTETLNRVGRAFGFSLAFVPRPKSDPDQPASGSQGES